jgi:hypothetical protein
MNTQIPLFRALFQHPASGARSDRSPERIVHFEDSPTRGHTLITRAAHASCPMSPQVLVWDRRRIALLPYPQPVVEIAFRPEALRRDGDAPAGAEGARKGDSPVAVRARISACLEQRDATRFKRWP